MRAILVAASLALVVSLVGTPLLIRLFRRRGYGQFIRADGPQTHQSKRGTPTMGGTMIIIAGLVGYFGATLALGPRYSAGGLLVVGVFALMGAVGFLDDYIKLRRNRSLGLSKTAKFGGQALIAVIFAVGAEYVADTSTALSFIGATGVDFAYPETPLFDGFHIRWLFIAWIFVILAATSNAVNLTDGLDGLAAGTGTAIFGAYTVIAFWIFRHEGQYSVEAFLHANALAIAAAAVAGAALGFLWWNAPPAKIFMGDTGSLAIGGMLAALAVMTETELLLIILAGLYVVETASVIIQIVVFRLAGRRAFRMAPIHHHFELMGWQETTVLVRFWILAGLSVAFALGLFYAEFLTRPGAPA